MTEFMNMQKCFSQYPKLYNNNHLNKTREKENTILMNHPEARRYRINEARKKTNQLS